jgi:hypothetical protein
MPLVSQSSLRNTRKASVEKASVTGEVMMLPARR